MIAGPFHPVGVVAGAFDDPGVCPVAARRVEVLAPGDVGPDLIQGALLLLRGKKPGRRPGGG